MGAFDSLLESVNKGNNENQNTIPGVITGLVKENYDKEHPGMVKVEFFLGEKGKNETEWIPVATPYAGKDHGMYALPEVGSEVVLAFQMGNRSLPIVIGCLWNKKNPYPKETVKDKNVVKKMRTKGGCEIIFSDEDKKEQIQIQTPKKLKVVLEDEKETIKITDKDGKNGVQIDTQKGEMTFLAEKSVTVTVNGQKMAVLDGKAKSIQFSAGKINFKGEQSIGAKAPNIKLEANASVGIKGNASVKVESSGTTQVKGSLVQIN